MVAYRTVYIPVEKKCEVKFILYIQPICDPHSYEPAHYLRDRFGDLVTFDTRKEAEERKAAQYAADKEAEIKEKEAKAAAVEAEANRKHEEQLANNERKKLTDMARENRWAVEAMTGAVARALK